MAHPKSRQPHTVKKPATPKPAVSKPPADPFAALVQAQVNQRFGPQEQQLQQTRQAIPSWFEQYKQQVAAASAANQAAQAQAQAQLAGLQGALAGAGTQVAQGLQSTEQQSAAQRGATVDPGLAQRAVDAAGVRQALLSQFAGQLAQQGATQAATDAENARFASGQQIGALQNVNTQLGNLQAQKGDYAVTARQALIDAQHKAALEDAAFGLDQVKAQQSAQQAAQNLALKRAQQKQAARQAAQRDATTRRGQTLTHEDRVRAIKNGRNKSAFVSPEQQGKAADQIAKAFKYARQIKQQTGGDKAITRRYLIEGQKGGVVYDQSSGKPKLNPDGTRVQTPTIPSFDPLWVNVAMDLAFRGFISPANIKLLHARGIRVNSLGYPTKTPKPKPAAPSGVAGGAIGDAINSIVQAAPK